MTEEKREIERFDFSPDAEPGGTWRLRSNDQGGEWMRFADHESALAEKDAEIERRGEAATREAEAADREQERAEKAERSREHTEYWYAVRWARLRDLTRDRSKAAEPGSEMAQVWADIACILANGTLGPPDHPYEPPTYAQQLNIAKHRAEKAEAALQERDAQWREWLEQIGRITVALEEAVSEIDNAGEDGLDLVALSDKLTVFARRLDALASTQPEGEAGKCERCGDHGSVPDPEEEAMGAKLPDRIPCPDCGTGTTPPTCEATNDLGDRCELPAGHLGIHRKTHPHGAAFWPNQTGTTPPTQEREETQR